MDCSICLSSMCDSSITSNLRCGHQFHVHCLRTWSTFNNNCPNCRTQLSYKNFEYPHLYKINYFDIVDSCVINIFDQLEQHFKNMDLFEKCLRVINKNAQVLIINAYFYNHFEYTLDPIDLFRYDYREISKILEKYFEYCLDTIYRYTHYLKYNFINFIL